MNSKVKFIAQSCKTAVSSLALYCKPKPGEGSCSSYKQGPVDWSNHHSRYRKLAKFPFPLSPTASLRVVGRECHTPLLKEHQEAKQSYRIPAIPGSRQISLKMYALCVQQRSRHVPTNLQKTLTTVVTLCPAKVAGCLDRCGHVKA